MANNVLLMGFHDLASVMSQRVSTVGFQVVSRAIQAATEEHNRQIDAMMSIFASRLTDAQRRYLIPGSGTLQPLDESGVPLPVQDAGYYDVAWPIQGGGTGYGQNRVARALMTVEEVQRNVAGSLMRDADWMRRHMLAALFTNVTFTFTDKLVGALTVQPLANGDTVTYMRRGGATAIDTHQLGSATITAALFGTIYTELSEHPGNGDRVVVYIPSASVATVTGLTGFVPVGDPDVEIGIGTNRLRSGGSADILGPGVAILGKINQCWVVEWPSVPDDYMIAVAPDAEDTPLAMREYPDAALQGFFTETHSPDGARLQVSYIRYAGFGALNRVSAVVVRTNNATYAIPSGLTAPLAV